MTTLTQTLPDFVGATVRGLEYFGWVPWMLVPSTVWSVSISARGKHGNAHAFGVEERGAEVEQLGKIRGEQRPIRPALEREGAAGRAQVQTVRACSTGLRP